MEKLKVSEVKDINQGEGAKRTVSVPGEAGQPPEQRVVHERSLDPERDWARVKCPNSHELVVEMHEGGSETYCPTCGVRFAYGKSDRDVTDSDAASAVDQQK